MSRQVPIKEAAEVLGVSEITVRRRIKANELLALKHETPQGYRWLVVLEDDDSEQTPLPEPDQSRDQPIERMPETPTQAPAHHPDTDRLIRSLEDRLSFAEEQIRFMQTQLHERTRETEQLHILLSQALQALPSGTIQAATQSPDHPADR